MTHQEAVLWEQLRNNKLDGPHFRRQQVIDGFIADFYCSAPALVIELDGSVHHDRADYDRERDKVIAAHHLQIVRVANDEIDTDIDKVLSHIRELCHTRWHD